MTQQSRDIRTRVGYEIAKGENSPDAVVAANTKIAGSYKPVSLAVTDLGADIIALNPQLQRMIAAEQQVASVGQVVASAQTQAANATVQHANATRLAAVALQTQGAEVQDLTNLYAALEQQERRAAEAGSQVAANAPYTNSAGNLSTGFGTLRAAGSALGTLSSNPAGSQAAALVGLTAEMGAFGAVVGLGAIAVKAVTAAEEARTKAAEDAAAALNQIADLASSGATSEEIREQIAQEEQRRAVLTQTQEALQEYSDRLDTINSVYTSGSISAEEYKFQIEALGQGVDTLTGGAVTAAGGVLDLNQLLNKNKESIDGVNTQIALHNLALNTEQVAYNDATAAAELFADQLAEATAETTSNILGMAQLAVQIENQTAEARAKAADALKVEILTLERFRDTVPQTEESLNNLNDQIELAREKLDAYAATTRTYADFIAEQQQRQETLNEATRNYLDAQEAIGEANSKVAAAQQAVALGAQEHADAISKIATEQTARETDVRRKADQQSEEDTAQHLRRIQEIEARYANDAEAAVGNRDALALYKAQQQRTTELDKEQAAYDERQTALQTQLDEQLDAVKDAGKKAADAEAENYRKREQQLQRALQDAQQEQNQANQLALAYERQINSIDLNEKIAHKNRLKGAEAVANNAELNDAITQANALVSVASYGRVTAVNEFRGMVNDMIAIVRGASYGIGGAAGSGPGGYAAMSTAGVQKIVDARVKKIVLSAAR